jgi:hypothetical protein
MNWDKALILIRQHINVGLQLEPSSKYRYVVEGPNYSCNHYDYRGDNGYKINIGDRNFIEIPISMLETLYHASVLNGGVYNNAIFAAHFKQQLKNHGCHVHVVGKIFSMSGVAIKKGNNFHFQL